MSDDPKELLLFKALHVAVLDSPIGKIWIESDGKLITRLSFNNIAGRKGSFPPVLNEAKKQLDSYFSGSHRKFDLPLQLKGTQFQKLVWGQLKKIPYGRSTTYKEIGDRIGGKGIARTVGGACGRNPIPILVPCHRVIGSNGLLTGYVGGLWRKKWLLEREGVIQRDLFSD